MVQNGIKLCIKDAKRKMAKRNKYVQKMPKIGKRDETRMA